MKEVNGLTSRQGSCTGSSYHKNSPFPVRIINPKGKFVGIVQFWCHCNCVEIEKIPFDRQKVQQSSTVLMMLPTSMNRIPPLPSDLEAIIFDCDGTLVNTMPFHLAAWSQVCQETGLCYSREHFMTKAGVPGRELIRDLARKQGIFLDVLNVYNRKRRLYIEETRRALPTALPISCVVNFLIEAKTCNESLLLAVASGSSRHQVEEVLELAGIRGCFDVIVGNEDYQCSKPSPDAFLTACEKLNVDPVKCWGFEDTDIGLQSIRNAGFGKAIDVRLLSGYPSLKI